FGETYADGEFRGSREAGANGQEQGDGTTKSGKSDKGFHGVWHGRGFQDRSARPMAASGMREYEETKRDLPDRRYDPPDRTTAGKREEPRDTGRGRRLPAGCVRC